MAQSMKAMERRYFDTYGLVRSFADLSLLTPDELILAGKNSLDFKEKNRLAAQSDAWKTPSANEFMNRVIRLDEKSYMFNGPDLTVIQSKKPILFDERSIRLTLPEIGEDLSELVRYPAYAIGSGLTVGKGVVIFEQKCIPLPEVHFVQEAGVFYSARLTPGGMDDLLITPGMSGGALAFETPRGWIVGGVISENFNNDHIKDKMTEKDLETLLPMYDIFQSFTDGVLRDLHALMGPSSSPAGPQRIG